MRTVVLSTLAVFLLATSGPALADEIAIGTASSGDVVFTSVGDGTHLDMNFAAPSGMSGATASFQSPNGTSIDTGVGFSFTNANPIVLTLQAGGNFSSAAAPTSIFSFGPAGSGDALAGTVSWSLVKDSTSFPDLIGTVTITAVAGTPLFQSDFHVGDVDEINMALDLPAGVTLDSLVLQTGGSNAAATLSVAEIPSAVPEPASLLLLGSGLIGLGAFGRRRFRLTA